ncbi:MAG TPA: hypothetical protein VF270_07225 [Ignavibacteriaceae bacterium]
MKNWPLLILFIPFISFFQNGQTEWKEVNLNYYLSYIKSYEKKMGLEDDYSFSLTYNVYSDYSDASPIKMIKGYIVSKKGVGYNTLWGNQLTVINNTLKVTLEKTKKRIIIQSVDSLLSKRTELQTYSNMAKFANKIFEKQEKDKVWFDVQLKKNMAINSVDLIFYKGQLQKIVIFSNHPYQVKSNQASTKKAKIVITYSNFKKGRDVKLSKFEPVSSIITVKNNKIVLNPIYKGFKIIDLRSN